MVESTHAEHPHWLGELERLVRDRYGEGRQVASVTRLGGGASRTTWRVDLAAVGELGGLILQRERPGGVRGQIGPRAEAAVMRAAALVGVPAPAVVAEGESDESGTLGGFLLTKRASGEADPRALLDAPEYAAARARFAEDVGAVLARLHAADPDEVPGLPEREPLAFYRRVLEDLDEPHPALELGFAWLAEHRPPAGGRSIVHGDFRLGNLLFNPGGLDAVLDWEIAHIGDPAEDLGWLCVRSWRFGGPGRAGGLSALADVLGAYHAAGGSPSVTEETVYWWEVLGTVKWAVICMLQAHAHRSGAERSVELAAIGRRTCSVERDLLDLLDVEVPPSPSEPVSRPTPTPPHDAPDAAELVTAVRDLLHEDLLPAARDRHAHLIRIAANALAIAEREITLGGELAARHRRRLDALGVADDHEFAARIRDGSLRGGGVSAAVAGAVQDKTLVAAPRRINTTYTHHLASNARGGP
jgi:aminoglycoside phosphotransferase (APT) family kinase protein